MGRHIKPDRIAACQEKFIIAAEEGQWLTASTCQSEVCCHMASMNVAERTYTCADGSYRLRRVTDGSEGSPPALYIQYQSEPEPRVRRQARRLDLPEPARPPIKLKEITEPCATNLTNPPIYPKPPGTVTYHRGFVVAGDAGKWLTASTYQSEACYHMASIGVSEYKHICDTGVTDDWYYFLRRRRAEGSPGGPPVIYIQDRCDVSDGPTQPKLWREVRCLDIHDKAPQPTTRKPS